MIKKRMFLWQSNSHNKLVLFLDTNEPIINHLVTTKSSCDYLIQT